MNKYYKEENYIHYSNCHEDPNVLLSTISYDAKTALSIASGGDNSFSLLTSNIEKLYVFDINPSQLALTKLKACAIKYLSYEDLLIFLGINKGSAKSLYEDIKTNLDEYTRNYFDSHLYLIDEIGIVNAGRFEYYFQVLKKKVLRFTHSKRCINKFMTAPTLSKQWTYYKKRFNNLRWRFIFKIFFSKGVMSKLGRDKEYFKYCSLNLPKKLKERLEIGFQNILNKDNCYLQYAVFNQFYTLPHYLKLENYEVIKKKIDNITYIYGNVEAIAKFNMKFDFFNLSDIFEYMSEEEKNNNENLILNMSNNNARIVFWNMIVERKFSKNEFITLPSEELFIKDQGLYYQRLFCYEVKL